MRLVGGRLVVALMAVALVASIFAPVTAAADITAWVEADVKDPGVGCVVGVSVEVRSAGAPVSGAEISVILSEDGTSNVISNTRVTTDGAGVAQMTVDTSAAWAGMKGWLEILVNGSYIGGQTMRVTDGGCTGPGSLVELSGGAATELGATSEVSETSAGTAGAVVIPNVPAYQQQRNLSCEYAALAIATGALGGGVSEYDFEAQVPLDSNPHKGYRGDITQPWGETANYGVYAAPLVPALAAYGFTGNAFYGEQGDLMAAIDRGEPTLVWLGMRGESGTFHETDAAGVQFQLTPFMHVMVAYGYDDGGVYLSDPGTGALTWYDWGTFNSLWSVIDGMALSVSW
jgi:uncharacterized protein YvpB